MALPTPQDVFLQQTSLDPAFYADLILSGKEKNFTQEEKSWFINHADAWVRWFHANDPKWTKPLNEYVGNKGIDKVWMFIKHWADAYEKNVEKYQQEHPMENLI